MEGYRAALTSRPVLETRRLSLRRPDAGDIPAIVDIAGDWEVASRLARMPHPYGEADAVYFLNTIVPAELVWMIVERTSRQVVGAFGLTMNEKRAGCLEIGYYVARKQWGRGKATEAGEAVLAYGIGLVGRARITSGYFVDNPASGRVLQKLGFIEVGLSTRDCLAAGTSKPSVEVALEIIDRP